MNDIKTAAAGAALTQAMLAGLGSTQDAQGVTAASAGGANIKNIQAILQQISQLVALLSKLTQAQPGAAAQGPGGPAMGPRPGAAPAAGNPLNMLQQLLQALGNKGTAAQPPLGGPAQTGPAQPAAVPMAQPQKAQGQAVPAQTAPGQMARPEAATVQNAASKLADILAGPKLVTTQTGTNAEFVPNQAAQPQAGGPAPKEAADLQSKGMSREQVVRVLTDNFGAISKDGGINIDDLKKIANGEKVNGMDDQPSHELRQAAKAVTSDPAMAKGLDTQWEKNASNADGIIGKDDLLSALSNSKTFAKGEKEALDTLHKHKDLFFNGDNKASIGELKTIADTGKLPNGNDAPPDLRAAAQRLTSNQWSQVALDNGKEASEGKLTNKLGDGEISTDDLKATRERGADTLRAETKSAIKSEIDKADSSAPAVQDVVKLAKEKFGDNAKEFITAAAQVALGENNKLASDPAVKQVISAMTEATGSKEMAAVVLGAAAKAL
jgi:hypothetical protein